MHDVVRTVAHRNVGSETCPYNSITLTDGLKSPYTVIFGPFAVQGVHRRFLARTFRIHEPTTLDTPYYYVTFYLILVKLRHLSDPVVTLASARRRCISVGGGS